jgi:hypothetical protein
VTDVLLLGRLEDALDHDGCPVCYELDRATRQCLKQFLRAEIQARFRRTRGLCVPHFRETLSQVDEPPTSTLLLEVQARSVRQLTGGPEAFRQAYDHRHVEPPSDRGAWQRVLDLFAGTRGGDAA